MTSVEAFVQALSDNGVEWISTLCGHGLDPLFAAADRSGIRLIDTRNEQTASYIADAYGKLTRRPGVCAVSSGVAHANALNGVVNAWFDGSPMLLITGSSAIRTAGLGHFQDMDQVALARPVTRFASNIDHPDRAVELLESALHVSVGPTPGPVHLTFPMDVQRTEVQPGTIVRRSKIQSTRRLADPTSIAAMISSSSAPLIIAGSGVWYAEEGESLSRFSERYAVPVAVPIWDRGCITRPIRTFMGVIGAATGGPELLAKADCIILAGAQPDYRVRFLQPGGIRSDAQMVAMEAGWDRLDDVYETTGGRVHSDWCNAAIDQLAAFRTAVAERRAEQARRGVHAIHIISALRDVLSDETVLLIDGGSIGQWVHQLLCDRYPGHWLTCGRSGVVGWGIGGAMGARLAFPDRPTILLSGDGAFTFNVADLECAVRQKLPFLAIVADDQGWGITRAGHVKEFGKPLGSTLGSIAFAELAESLGARGVTATTPETIALELQRGLSMNEVTVMHVPIVGGNP